MVGSSEKSGGPISLPSPSFEIRGAVGSTPSPRWDRVDSRALIALARRIYFSYLSDTPGGLEPIGVVLIPDQSEGRVVFEASVLLPDEEFVGLEMIRGRISRGRNRWKG